MLSDAEYAGGKICSSCDATGMAVNLIILSETYYVRVLAGRRPKIAQCLLLRRGGGVLLQVPVRQWNTILVGRLEWNIPEFYSFIRRQNTAERFITLWGRVKRLWKVTAGIISFKVSWGPGGCHTYMHSGLSVIWRRIWWQLVGWLVIVSPIWSNDTHTVLLALMSFFFPFS